LQDLETTCKKMVKDLKKWPNKPIQREVNPLRGFIPAAW
jgi:hypothetical protein